MLKRPNSISDFAESLRKSRLYSPMKSFTPRGMTPSRCPLNTRSGGGYSFTARRRSRTQKPLDCDCIVAQISYSLGGSQYAVAQSLPEFRRHNGMIPISCAPITPARKKNKYFFFLFIDKFTLGMQLFRRVSNARSCVTNESPSPWASALCERIRHRIASTFYRCERLTNEQNE
jgi:hypothetical protein